MELLRHNIALCNSMEQAHRAEPTQLLYTSSQAPSPGFGPVLTSPLQLPSKQVYKYYNGSKLWACANRAGAQHKLQACSGLASVQKGAGLGVNACPKTTVVL